MTVCIAAIGNNSQAIVMVADKALTYGTLSGDSGTEKIVPIGRTGWVALVAGDVGSAEQILKQAAVKMKSDGDIARSEETTSQCIQIEFQDFRSKLLKNKILTPRFLTDTLIVSRTSDLLPFPDRYFLEISNEIKSFVFECEMIVCGFDYLGKPHIFSISEPGLINGHDLEGYTAIGLGASAAISRLLWWKIGKKDPLNEMLYFLLDAKACAEQMLTVGFEWDAMVLVKGKRDVIRVKKSIKDLLDDVYDKQNVSPFREKTLPGRWKQKLERYSKSLLASGA